MSDKLIKFLERQVTLEDKIVESVHKAVDQIENEAVSTALKGVALDSKKHAMMYKSVISLMTTSSAALNEEQLDIQKKVIYDHIQMEEAVIAELKNVVPTIEDDKIGLILSGILKDEERHHKLLKTLYEILVRGESVTEGDWWDSIWGDVPGLWG
jgi:rubrerythrin